jgi:hypothetical protein
VSAPAGGRCCSCGYAEPDETPCPARGDEIHCVHWWDGPGDGEEVDWSDAALSEYAGEEIVGGMTKAERESVAAWDAFCFARVLYGYVATEEEDEHLPTCPVPFRPCDCGDAEDGR